MRLSSLQEYLIAYRRVARGQEPEEESEGQ